VLFLGESPPAGGTFFYYANSKLYDATREAFEAGIPALRRTDDFLDAFKRLGCYLEDLSPVPVNHLDLKDRGSDANAAPTVQKALGRSRGACGYVHRSSSRLSYSTWSKPATSPKHSVSLAMPTSSVPTCLSPAGTGTVTSTS
jgi:hypothetical protein